MFGNKEDIGDGFHFYLECEYFGNRIRRSANKFGELS
jgi:hypothetical protein